MDNKNIKTENIESNKENIDSTNIFNDFVDDKDLLKEVSEIKKENDKDVYTYLLGGAKVLQSIFWIGLIFVGIIYMYIYSQNKTNFISSNLLSPVCGLFIGDIEKKDGKCSTITYLKEEYTKELDYLKRENIENIINIIEGIYKVKYFTKTKEVIFLLDKSQNKLPVLTILEEFDSLKNEFYNFDKQKIQCSGLIISGVDKTLTMNCNTYSAGYEKGIRGFDGGIDNKRRGTSISIANSFINFIDIKSDTFTVIDRQKLFNYESVIGEKTDFTNRTSFTLKLEYNL